MTQERMHPADLRTLVAALNLSGIQACEGSQPNMAGIVKSTDALLAELAKTEPSIADLCPRCRHRQAMGVDSDLEACLEATLEENARMKDEACRYYLPDGTYTTFDPELALEMRKAAAREMFALQARLTEARAEVEWLREEDRQGHEAYGRLSKEKADLLGRLAAIDAAKAGEPPCPVGEMIQKTIVDGARDRLIAWGRQGWDTAAALRVELAEETKARESWGLSEELRAQVRAEGEKAERERIAAFFDSSSTCFAVIHWELGGTSRGPVLDIHEIRAVLEDRVPTSAKEVDDGCPF